MFRNKIFLLAQLDDVDDVVVVDFDDVNNVDDVDDFDDVDIVVVKQFVYVGDVNSDEVQIGKLLLLQLVE